MSLRDWQANFKAQQATQPAVAETPTPEATTETGPVRVKRLVARKRRKMKQAASSR